MNYQDPYGEPRRDIWEDDHGTPGWAKAIASLILVLGVAAAIVIYSSRQSDGHESVAKVVTVRQAAQPKQAPAHQQHPDQATPKHEQPSLQPASEGPGNRGTSGGGAFLGSGAEASFDSLASSLPASVGLAVLPLGGGKIREFGDLREGHAWSSIKVPILATLLKEQGETLGAEEESLATSAITASDNEAAAALFDRIEASHGGLDGASAAVGEVLHAAGATSTEVATAPPPPGAVSTYGQTVWSVGDAARFFSALGRCEVLGPTGTGYVESLMEEVIPEQRWGLGEGGFPSDWRVGMKGGWGPEAESGGGYLVRQSGLIQDSNGGLAVAMIARDGSGSYPAGASDLTRIAQWLAAELEGLGPEFHSCTS